TTARVLKTLLERLPENLKVEIVTTDSFLFPNEVLEMHNLMNRKGFPESYDIKTLIKFLIGIKSGIGFFRIPVYSHVEYDIIKGSYQEIKDPDVIILEGLNVLQVKKDSLTKSMYVSDFLDFSIYVDSRTEYIMKWFIERFLILKRTSFKQKNAYFYKYASLSDEDAVKIATDIWKQINEVNLIENILSTKSRAQLILEKDANHNINKIMMRKL
ncbi:MAG: type I pantothenate kinase, partial [Thermoplasmata archaeon]